MSLIKVGLEATREDLHKEILAHPCRYLFILATGNRAALCLRTCDGTGENLQSHVVDCLTPDSEGNLVSLFEEELQEAVMNRNKSTILSDGDLSDGDEICSISPDIAEKIGILPGFVDWIISSVPSKDRNIVIYPVSWAR